jgi:hypothetical protein
MTRIQRIELWLFALFFFSFAYFHQGGGWNQNARFAEVRAMVEEGRFAIDNYLVYRTWPDSEGVRRVPVERAAYVKDGVRYNLAWVDGDWNLAPVDSEQAALGGELSPMVEACASGDIGYVPSTGHFHPNKPPGTSFLGLPAYWVLYHVEKWAGVNPDHWWVLTINAWLTSACSVGALAAAGCIAFFRLALSLEGVGVHEAVVATVSLALGTTFFPFATLFFDHSATAALLVCAVYLAQFSKGPRGWAAAGLMTGCATLTNYLAAVTVVFIGAYLCFGRGGAGRFSRGIWFALGGLPAAALLGGYGVACFGSPFAISNDFQNPLFREQGPAFLGMFAIPQSAADLARIQYVASLLLFSPIRGLFFLCPVLLAGAAGFYWMVRSGREVSMARLCLGIGLFFFLANATFNGFHAGHSAGPRYLIPALPFLILPMVYAVSFGRRWVTALCAVSVGVQGVLTCTDAQNPTGIGGFARVEGVHSEWTYNLLSEYAWPLLSKGRAWPLLRQQIELQLDKEFERAESADLKLRSLRREELNEISRRGDVSPFLLASIRGPVSVNPVGVYEGALTYGMFAPGTPQTRFASFNAGEFLFPESRWSLLPLAGGWLMIGTVISRFLRVAHAEGAGPLKGAAESAAGTV